MQAQRAHTEAEVQAAIALMLRVITAARNSNHAGEVAIVAAARALVGDLRR